MKKIIFCLMMVLSLSATAKLFAQNGGGQQRMEAMRTYLKDSVNLSDAMIDSVIGIRMQYQPQMRGIYMDQSASDADKQTKIQNLRTSMEARFKAAGITDDQIQKMEAREDRMRASMRNRMGNGNNQ